MNSNILLSVRLMTYNHSKHILTCLNGIEEQQTSFEFEVIIGDDFSEDNNVELIKKFISSSTNKNITYSLLDRKKGDKYDIERQKKGRLYNFVNIIENCKGKYIALLDGDDYWTDSLKLQKQVDFLENNPDFNICFTQSNMLKKGKLELHPIPEISAEGIYNYNNLLEHHNFITTASTVFRRTFDLIPNWFYKLPYGDFGLYLLTCKTAQIKCLPEVMSVYRIHEEGIWQKQTHIRRTLNKILFNNNIYLQLTPEQQQIVIPKHKKLIEKLSSLKHPNSKLMRVISRTIFKYKYRLNKV